MLDQSMVAWFQRWLIRMHTDANITRNPDSASTPDGSHTADIFDVPQIGR